MELDEEERECGNNARLIKAANCELCVCRQGQTTPVEVGGGPNKTAAHCLLFRTTLNQPKMFCCNLTQSKHYNNSSARAFPAWQPILYTHTALKNCFSLLLYTVFLLLETCTRINWFQYSKNVSVTLPKTKCVPKMRCKKDVGRREVKAPRIHKLGGTNSQFEEPVALLLVNKPYVPAV
jgi:hypothetical protein